MPTTVAQSFSNIKTDPLRNYRFQVNISHTTSAGQMSARLGFQTVSGLTIETSLVAYREGGMNTTTQKMPGQSDFPTLSLSRGLIAGYPDQWLWFKEIFDVIQGTGPNVNNGDFRSDIDIYLLAFPWTRSLHPPVRAKWHVYNAWPQSLGFGDLDAGGNAVEMEQMVLQHEGFAMALASNDPTSDVYSTVYT